MKNYKDIFKTSDQIKEYFKEPKKILWLIACAIVMWNIVFIYVVTFLDNVQVAGERPLWKEYLLSFFFVTNISNIMGGVYVVMFLFTNVNQESIFWRRFKIATASTLTLVFLLYWTVLAKDNLPEMNGDGLKITRSIFTHGIVPVSIVGLMLFDDLNPKTKIVKTQDDNKTLLWNIIIPVVWILIQIILYYSMGGNLEENAMYDFLDFNNQSIALSLGAIFGTTLFFALLTWIYSFIHNLDYKKINKKNK